MDIYTHLHYITEEKKTDNLKLIIIIYFLEENHKIKKIKTIFISSSYPSLFEILGFVIPCE